MSSTISFLVTVCDEFRELDRLLKQLSTGKSAGDEIVVVYDSNKVTDDVKEILVNFDNKIDKYSYLPFDFKGNFSDYKNFGNSLCKNGWIFQIDADEYLSLHLYTNLHNIINVNEPSNIDLIAIPRVNIVKGITQKHIDSWGWFIGRDENYVDSDEYDTSSESYKFLKDNGFIISEHNHADNINVVRYYCPIINYPDYQTRLYKNKEGIKWEGKLHERVVGSNNFARIPVDNDLDILHFKDIDRQERQNNYYNTL